MGQHLVAPYSSFLFYCVLSYSVMKNLFRRQRSVCSVSVLPIKVVSSRQSLSSCEFFPFKYCICCSFLFAVFIFLPWPFLLSFVSGLYFSLVLLLFSTRSAGMLLHLCVFCFAFLLAILHLVVYLPIWPLFVRSPVRRNAYCRGSGVDI